MKWFQHDSDASTDAKVKKLIIRHGAEGYAIYFHCIELIAAEVNDKKITFELEHDAEIIADNLKIKGTADLSAIDKVNNIMKTIINLGLFSEKNNRIFCFKLALRLDNTISRAASVKTIQSAIKKKLGLLPKEDKNQLPTNEQRSCNVAEEKTLHNTTKNKKKVTNNKRFVKPTIDQLKQYSGEINFNLDCQYFTDYYDSNGWKVGRNKMVDWKATVRSWRTRDNKETKAPVNTLEAMAARTKKKLEENL